MSAIRGRPPKEKDSSTEKSESARSPKALDSPDDKKRDDKKGEKLDRELREKEKKERTKALDDLAPPVAPKASGGAAQPTSHHSRTHTAPAMTRPTTSGSAISRISTSLSSSDGARVASPAAPDSNERRRLTMSSTRASVSGTSRDEVRSQEKPRARDDDALKDSHRERTGSFGAADLSRRPKSNALSSPLGISDLQIVKQPKPYHDPRISSPGSSSPDQKNSPTSTNVRSPTMSRTSVAGTSSDRDASKDSDSRSAKETRDPDLRPSSRESRDTRESDLRTSIRESRDPDARGSRIRDERTAREREAREKETKERETREREAKEKESKEKDTRDKEIKEKRSGSGGSRISRAGVASDTSLGGSQIVSRGSRIGTPSEPSLASPTSTTPPNVASPSTTPSVTSPPTSPLMLSASSGPVTPSALSPLSKPVALTGSASLPAQGKSPAPVAASTPAPTPTSPSAAPTTTAPTTLPAPAIGASGAPAADGGKAKDDISVGDRFKIFMNISPRATQSMVSIHSSSLQAARDKYKTNASVKATEPMDLRDVVLRMRDPNYGLEMKETKISLFSTKKCVTGAQFIDWIISQKLAGSGARAEAVAIATALLNTGHLELAKAVNEKEKGGIFSDSASLYTFGKAEEEKKKSGKDSKADIISPHSPRRRWFGSSLPDIVSQEPTEKVPRVVTVLLNAVLAMNGARTEGIFRISPEGSLIDSLKEQLEKGNLTVTGHDPHVPACCLKLFLRELRQPVIPDALYDECTKAAENPVAAQEAIAKLPETNRNLVNTLLTFLVDLAAPENVVVTKMTVSNLAVVFAPCLLRCPLSNPLDIMRNSSVEQMFVQTLIEARCPPSYVRVAPQGFRTISVPLKDADGSSSLKTGKDSGKRLDFSVAIDAAKSNSGKQIDMAATTITTTTTTTDIPRTQQRKNTSESPSGSGKKIDAMSITHSAPTLEGASLASEKLSESSSNSGKKLDLISTGAAADSTATPERSASGKSINFAEISHTKSDPIAIPTGGGAALAESTLSSSASVPSSSPNTTNGVHTPQLENFSAPSSPAVLSEDATAHAAAAHPVEVSAQQQQQQQQQQPQAQDEDAEFAQLLKDADPALALKLGPQLREVRQRLADSAAANDLELVSFYRTQMDALRRQLSPAGATSAP